MASRSSGTAARMAGSMPLKTWKVTLATRIRSPGDTSKAHAELGWQPGTSDQAVRECPRNLADHQQVSAPAHA